MPAGCLARSTASTPATRCVRACGVNTYFGYPVESTRDGPNTDRQFVGVSADFGTFANAWDLSVYAVSQDYFGVTDRQAIGSEVRYFKPGVTMVGLFDYDIHYQDLNDALLLGTFALPARWTLNFNLDHRKSPSLTTRNAMIGQPVTSFDQLFDLFSRAEIEQLARDRTAQSRHVHGFRSRDPLGERWQWSIDVASMTFEQDARLGRSRRDTRCPARTLSVATQVLGYGLFGRGDVSTLGFQYQDGSTQQTMSLGVSSQFPIGERWRLQPRLRVDQRKFDADQFDSADVHTDPAHRAAGSNASRWSSRAAPKSGRATWGRPPRTPQGIISASATDTTSRRACLPPDRRCNPT